MSPRTEKQFEIMRVEKRDLIMHTALELFALQGYEATTINQIANKAGISKGLMYNYFSGKEELLVSILNKGIDEIMFAFDPNKDGVLEVHELEYFINESMTIVKNNRIFWKLYMSVLLQQEAFKFIEKRIEQLYEPIMKMMVNYFQDTGFKNPLMETMLFGALLDGITFNFVLKPELFPIEQLKLELINRYCKHNNKKQ